MTSKNDATGGYVGTLPTQNTSVHPGFQSRTYQNRQQRDGNYPGAAGARSMSSVNDSFTTTGNIDIVFNGTIEGGGGTLTISGDLGSTTRTLTTGQTTGTDWTIVSNTTLRVTGTFAANYASANTAVTISAPAGALRSGDDFPANAFSGQSTRRAGGSSSSDAAGSAKSLYNTGFTASQNYWIRNADGSNAREMYCDQSTDGGGWTRFANIDVGNRSNTYDFRYSATNYNTGSGVNTSSSHYNFFNWMVSRRQYSTSNYLQFMFEHKNGNYRFKMDSYYNDPGTGNRNFSHMNGYSNSHFDAGWFNNNNNGWWAGHTNTTNSNCVNSQNVVHAVYGYYTHNGGYFGINRGYKSTGGTSSGCGDHCGNIRRYWVIYPYQAHQQHCYSGYYNLSNFQGGNRCSVYLRERGTLPSGGY